MKLGTFLLLLTSLCWATDSLFRVNIIKVHGLDPLLLVFFEHALLVAFTSWILVIQWRKFLTLGKKGWVSSCVMGFGGSALALYLFTLSFKYINPSVAIVLQKLHPVFAVSIAVIFLKEEITKNLLIWGGVALFSGFVLSSAEIIKIMHAAEQMSLANDPSQGMAGILLSLMAAVIWGASTAAGRYMAVKTGFSFSMVIRFSIQVFLYSRFVPGKTYPWD